MEGAQKTERLSATEDYEIVPSLSDNAEGSWPKEALVLMSGGVEGECSWCLTACLHEFKEKSLLSPNKFECTNCKQPTIKCIWSVGRKCTGMARSSNDAKEKRCLLCQVTPHGRVIGASSQVPRANYRGSSEVGVKHSKILERRG